MWWAQHRHKPWIEKRRFSSALKDDNERLVPITESRLEELLQAEIQYFATVPVRAVSLREVLDCLEPRRAAKFIQADVPKRMAVRIRMIENLSCWHRVPELVQVHADLNSWYRSLRLVERGAKVGLNEFTACVKNVRDEGKDAVRQATVGMHKLKHTASGTDYGDDFLNQWLDSFLLSRIGSNMLLDQYIACVSHKDGGLGRATGIIDPACDAALICAQASKAVTNLCLRYSGKAPPVVIEAYRAGEHGIVDSPILFSYIPAYLHYVMVELLKNSFFATIKNAIDQEDLQKRPIHIAVSTDDHRIIIRASDRAGGIPYEVGDRIWSYLYGAAAGHTDDQAATPLAGYGVGLPLSRLHARYLGGELEIRSFPGLGTDAYLLLHRIEADQVEYVPGGS